MAGNIFMSITFLSLLGCCSTSHINQSKKVTLIGTALEDKGGAFVLTDKGMYFLDQLDEWKEMYYGKKVEVSGKLVFEKHEKYDENKPVDSMLTQKFFGTRAIIKKPKYHLIQ